MYRSSTAGEFRRRLSAALYGGRRIDQLYVSDLQRQIAALAIDPSRFDGDKFLWHKDGPGVSSIYTTNFEPLLELGLAIAEAEGTGRSSHLARFRYFRQPRGAADADTNGNEPQIRHLHGWVDPDGDASGTLVYAESHYISLQRSPAARPNRQTEEILTARGATIVLGMSLTDPNLRRLLYSVADDSLGESSASTYVFLRQEEPEIGPAYVARFWDLLKVGVIPVTAWAEIPNFLRQIQWRPPVIDSVPGWLTESLRITGLTWNDIDRGTWADYFGGLLQALHKQLSLLFLTAPREQISLALFAPVSGDSGAVATISQVGLVGLNGELDWTPTNARDRTLDIRHGAVQGLAGLAFVEGTIREAIDGQGKGLDLGFTPEMRRDFDGGDYRAWRSLLAIPILGGPFWVPLGVICLHSTSADPFWKRLERRRPKHFGDFRQAVLKAGSRLLRRSQRSD
ncbi:MAG: SIR2 family protein [Bryobacteraceae bacterium]|nr:SIR2 family protein [Bryobacteraceae bacterium]